MNKAKIQIIEAAAVTFNRFGFKKTTMEDIAYASGKGKSSLYYYFKNKEEVFEAVVEKEAENLKMEISAALNKSPQAVDKLKTYITLRMNRFIAKGNLHTALSDNFLSTFSFIEKIRNKYREWEIEIISSILKEGVENKQFKDIDVNFAATTLLIAMIGFELPLLQNPDASFDFDRKIKQIIDMLFYGICT